MPNLTDIPGISQIWTRTKGDPRIKIAILDGAADLERSCFQGAKFSQFKPYWSEDIELNEEYYYYLNLSLDFNKEQKDKKDDPDHDKEESKKEQEAFFAPFPPAIRQRIELSSHATHISSTILGQHGTPAPGIAPLCTALNIPISFAGDDFISPVNLTHAINTALKWGANIIHIAACHPTQTGVAPDLFARAVKQCQDNNMLIVAPGGNDKGECWCIPSILPGVITVGAMRDDGQPFKFSNYGGEYQNKGVMANGENILGAQPGTEEPIREKGTSCAAPIVTGISALLMSMQLQRGEQPNAEAVREAILNSAIPCNPEEVEEPERCLLGKLNIPGAFELLTGETLEPHPQPLSYEERGVRISRISRSQVLPGNATLEALPLTISSGRALETAFPAGDWERETYPEITPPKNISPVTTELIFQNRILNERYALASEAFHGSFSSVYPAIDLYNSYDQVAVKLFELQQNCQEINRNDFIWINLQNLQDFKKVQTESIRHEKQALSELQHPRIITLLDSGIDRDTDYEFHVFEWMEKTLEKHLEELPFIDWNYFYNHIGLPILEGLAFCHYHHYIHYDIHPSNILINSEGQVKIADFGVAKKLNEEFSISNPFNQIRRVNYTPPEISEGIFSYSIDNFSFGVLILDCLTDIAILNYEDIIEALQKLNAPATVKKLIATTVSLDLEKRPATAGILLSKFQAIQQVNTSTFPVKESEKILNSAVSASTPLTLISSDLVIENLSHTTKGITPSAASKLVYALGTIGYDFGNEARRDTFKQLMPAVNMDGAIIPANPYDSRQMVNYLSENPAEAKPLIWTLNQELTPIYALEPVSGFAADIYETLILMLAGQIQPENSDDFVERVSIPARLTDRTVELFSGQVVPVISLTNTRGMYGWKVNSLVDAALQTVITGETAPAQEIAMRKALSSFLSRVYYDLQNLGQLAKDRALNFSVTNAFQAASSFSQAISTGMQLDSIEVEKSPFCRINSDCWDVKLKFFDPENGSRAKKVFLFTIDVSDRIPVTLGHVRSWSVRK